MSYRLHPAAEHELSAAATYDAEQASTAVAAAYLAEFERIAELLSRNQGFGTPSKGGMRVHPFRRFLYSLIHRESESGIDIYAVAHHRREPGYWATRAED